MFGVGIWRFLFDFCLWFLHNGIVTYLKKGFTLIELMLVMALIMILSVVGISSYTVATTKSRDTLRKGELSQIAKALESFNQDVGRYPKSSSPDNEIMCYSRSVSTVTHSDCEANRKLVATIDGESTTYITIPNDPDSFKQYTYISPDDDSDFGLYAALENTSDKDMIIDSMTGLPDLDPWGVSCGNVQCNYKITENGLVKSL